MRAPVSWLREYVDLPTDVSASVLADKLTFLGLKLEALEAHGDVEGPLVVGRVLGFGEETHSNGKTIRWCRVDVGEREPRGIVCGARNFEVGDLVVVALPGTALPGGFEIGARRTYGHVSDGMICSARELGLGDDHTGILVLAADEGSPGTAAPGLLQLRDDVIEMEINPDRAYALSMRGVARDAAIGFGAPYRDPALSVAPPADGDGYPVRVEDPVGCDAFTALEVTGTDPGAPTPRWLSRRLQLSGVRPISLLVDVTNYVMLELGNPIHGYDRSALRGPIAVRRARAGERLTTLDGVARDLDPGDLLITDDRGPIGLAGVMGGEETELGPHTTDVVIEAAHFDPVSIARTAKRHRLPSEASRRFERGVDPTIGPVAARRVAELLVELGGGRIAATATIVGKPQPREPIAMDCQLPSQVAGFPIPTDSAVRALTQVGCAVTVDDRVLTAVPPQWRSDLTDPSDLVEEVVRVVGYQLVPSVLPSAPAGRGLTAAQRLRRRVGVALAADGYVETLVAPFASESDADDLGLGSDDDRRRALRVANPLSDELPLLRTTLLPGLLRTVARNAARGQGDVGLFEIGSVYRLPAGGLPAPPAVGVDRAPTSDQLAELDRSLPVQPLRVAAIVCGDRALAGWWGAAEPSGWFDAVEAARVIARAVGVDVDVVSDRHAPWHPGRCAAILLDHRVVGHAGELHPRALGAFGLAARTSAVELDLGVLLERAGGIVSAPRLSSYPVGKEDVALVVGDTVAAADVAAALRAGAGPLLESVRLFDVYLGDQVGLGRKSLAFALRFRAGDRTLTEAEIRDARDAAVAEATARTGAVQRV